MKILLAVDFSAASEVAANEVAARSWPAGTSIEVLSVLDTTNLLDEIIVQDLLQRWEGRAQSLAKPLRATAIVLKGDPKAVIVDRAKETGADFIVLGSHDAMGLERFLLGSVARSVVRHASGSVMVVRAAITKDAPRRILLATDGSESSKRAAASVAERPWPAGTEVRVFSAVEIALTPLQSAFVPPFVENEQMEVLRAQAMKRAEEAIAQAEQILSGAGLKTSESISVLVESPKQTIVDEAAKWGADLVVVGSHGMRGIDRFLLGSVSEAVAMHAGCSVEVIRII